MVKISNVVYNISIMYHRRMIVKNIIKEKINKFIVKEVESRIPDSLLKIIHNKYFKKAVKIGCLLLVGAMLHAGFSNDIDLKEHEVFVNSIQEEVDTKQKDLADVTKERDDLKEEFDKLVNQTKEYTSLDEQEKELVDVKIQEVKQATADQLAKEKAEKEETERIKKEQEEAEAKAKAEEEARIKAEEDAKAKQEEEARKVEEQKKLENVNCIKKAEQYINYAAFSRSGLISQLEYEGYSSESAEYSVDSLNIDWNNQCAKKAQEYLDYTSFSRSGLYDQLSYEEFSSEQIEYGLSQVGY